MTDCMKGMTLDYLLLKPYFKSMMIVMVAPIVFTWLTGSIMEGLSFAATAMAMTSGYTFAVAEKNNLSSFYGFLPTKKSSLVKGRYAIVMLVGLVALSMTLVIQLGVLAVKKTPLVWEEIAISLLVCLVLFIVYTSVQIPGFYRFGSIKGKLFMFIPTAGFLVVYAFVNLLAEKGDQGSQSFPLSTTAIVLIVLGLLVLFMGISFLISKKIVEKRGL